jgi:hypothetical protein
MEKNEHIVFKCPYETLGKDYAAKKGVIPGSFVYFYINLKEAQEIVNPKISA